MKYKSILITGGTGFFGKYLVDLILKKYKNFKRIVIYSRDEFKQYEMQTFYKTHNDFEKLRFFIGDIRDQKRLSVALQNIDIVIHAAALKQVVMAEYNPYEFIKTNVMGAQNIISESINNNVKKVIALSTDKAAAPVNLYGATKLCSDKLFTSANNHLGKKDLRFSVVRYGNVFGSRGSVFPVFLDAIKRGKPLTVTDKRMTRFNISIEQACDMVIWAIKNSRGGEIFVPKLSSYRLSDLLNAFGKKHKVKVIGIRDGEKLHETLITVDDSYNTYEFNKNYYAIIHKNKYYKKISLKKVKKGFHYNSFDNNDFITVNKLKELIKKGIN